MLYLLALLTGIFQIALGNDVHLFGGVGYFLPAILILAAGEANWSIFGIAMAGLGLSSFFTPIPLSFWAVLLPSASLCYFVLQRGIDVENRVVAGSLASLCVALFVFLFTFATLHDFSYRLAGSLILTLPVVIIWSSWPRPARKLL